MGACKSVSREIYKGLQREIVNSVPIHPVTRKRISDYYKNVSRKIRADLSEALDFLFHGKRGGSQSGVRYKGIQKKNMFQNEREVNEKDR